MWIDSDTRDADLVEPERDEVGEGATPKTVKEV